MVTINRFLSREKQREAQVRILASFTILILSLINSNTSAAQVKELEITQITRNLYRLYVDGFVNMLAFTDAEGVLLADSGFNETAPRVKAILEKLSGKNIKYIVNTHSDYDHLAGNGLLGETATVIVHPQCRAHLLEYADPAFDIHFDKSLFLAALPSITADEIITLHLTDEEVLIIPLAGAHTGSDLVVYFQDSNVAALGDMVQPDSFPVIELERGGGAQGLIDAVDRLISLFPPDCRLITGHGRMMRADELPEYRSMIVKTMAIVKAGMKGGMTVNDMQGEGILKGWESWDSRRFPEESNTLEWIETIYLSPSH